MTKWPMVEIGDLIEVITPPKKIFKSDFSSVGEYPVIDQSQEEVAGWTDDRGLLISVNKPLVIFGDHTCIVKYTERSFAQGADGIKILQTSERILPKFLYFYLFINPIIPEGYKRHFSKLKKTLIPLPPISVQSEVVHRLDRTNDLKKKREEADKKMATFAPALFHEMFGDPGKNEKGWEMKKLGEVCNVYQPKTITSTEILKHGPYRVYGANGIIGYYDKFNHEHTEIAVTCRGATSGTINLTEPESWITGNAMIVQPQDSQKINRIYLYHLLRVTDLKRTITGAAQPQITKASLSPFFISIPPLALQNQFAERIAEAQALQEKQGLIKKKLKEMFAGLMAHYV